jgi:ATP-binding cassette, subfamily F, member 3
MIQLQNICLAFGGQIVFDHISCIIQTNQRIGLVGANGTGKSTLLKAIMGQQPLDEGLVTKSPATKIAYLPQEVVLTSQKTVFEEALATYQEFYELSAQLAQLEISINHNPREADIEMYAHIHQKLQEYQAAELRQQVLEVLQGLGFSASQQHASVSTLSVGWKMRLVLAKLLLQKADFYLFDEPTNHLDIVAKDWFLSFLKNSSCGFLLVCHERYFLDMLCTDIIELERGQGHLYKGNYHAYEQQKEHHLHQIEKAYAQQQRDIAQKMATIERFRASASKAKMAQSMLKQVEAIERITLPPSPKTIRFHFKSPQRAGKTVLSFKNLTYRFGDKLIFDGLSQDIERGEKVALIAPNGMGKTTLFNVIAGIYPLQDGSVTFGHNVQYALFAQDQDKVLPKQTPIFEYVLSQCSRETTEQDIRTMLGAFLFSNEAIHKKLGVLSGGEKNRVSMITILMQGANFLLLDEPTNHLDMQSKDILLRALQQFEGTILFVSHDHDFINHLATRILDLTPQGLESYQGNYTEYLYQKRHCDQPVTNTLTSPSSGEQPKIVDGKQLFELRKKSKKLEAAIDNLEHKIQKTEEQVGFIEYGSPEYSVLQETVTALRATLEKSLVEWEQTLLILEKNNR